MSIYIRINCSMCGKNQKPFDAGEGGSIGTQALVEAVKKGLKLPWVVQVNGDNIDTYCCAECAE